MSWGHLVRSPLHIMSAALRDNRRNRVGLLVLCALLVSWLTMLKGLPSIDVAEYSRASDSSTHTTSMIHAIAHLNFPMDLATGKMKLPRTIKHAVIDVGARESDYLGVLENTNSEDTAVFLFDPLPDSGVELAERVASFSRRGTEKKWLDPLRSNQAFFTRAALGEKEEITEFSVGSGPACSSLLAESDQNDFWCAKPKQKLTVVVLTLAGFLPLLDKKNATKTIAQQHDGGNHDNSTGGVEQIHLKIDAEGADLVVLRGAGDFLRLCDTVVIECNSDGGKKFREGECVARDAVAYMDTLGFKLYRVEGQGNLVNIFWVHPEYRGPVPKFLKNPRIVFRKFYYYVEDWVAAGYSPAANYSMPTMP